MANIKNLSGHSKQRTIWQTKLQSRSAVALDLDPAAAQMDSLLLELGKTSRPTVLSWRDELESVRTKFPDEFPTAAPPTARALKPLSSQPEAARELREPRPTRVKRPAVAAALRAAEHDVSAAASAAAASAADTDASATLQQRNAALEQALLTLGEELEARRVTSGSPRSPDSEQRLDALMEQLRAAGVNIGSAGPCYVPFSPGMEFTPNRTQHARSEVDPDDDAPDSVLVNEAERDEAARPESELVEPDWLVDAAATLAAGGAARFGGSVTS